MPYIKQDDRVKFHQVLRELAHATPETAGELNYLVTRICHAYLGGSPNYQKFNDVVGALEGAKLELYRRKVADYEDKKIEENGDV